MLREAGRILLGQAVADGFLTGAILALGALGASLSLQILRFAHFSHAELLTWGGYIALTFTTHSGRGREGLRELLEDAGFADQQFVETEKAFCLTAARNRSAALLRRRPGDTGRA